MGEKGLPHRVVSWELYSGRRFSEWQDKGWKVFLEKDMSVLQIKFKGWRRNAQRAGREVRQVEEGQRSSREIGMGTRAIRVQSETRRL